ncbi:MAG: hydroxylamine reductase, partial [Candidatus Omnitrophica bacterium]|nr:hydroxylamine reductase [Candidatus Omnitrophota bacterium]
MEMLCRQCEQTAGGKGCAVQGVCGKTAETAILQDELIYGLKSLAVYGTLARELGVKVNETDRFVMEALFTTVTNVNFDPPRIEGLIKRCYVLKEKMKEDFFAAYKRKHGTAFTAALPGVASWKPGQGREALLKEVTDVWLKARLKVNEDIQSLREILLFGLKGMAAY